MCARASVIINVDQKLFRYIFSFKKNVDQKWFQYIFSLKKVMHITLLSLALFV
jgi:hypothetical protein